MATVEMDAMREAMDVERRKLTFGYTALAVIQ
jgi:hypothetical protein